MFKGEINMKKEYVTPDLLERNVKANTVLLKSDTDIDVSELEEE